MAASHYAYNVLKMPSAWGVLSVKSDRKDAIFCVEQVWRTAAAASPESTDAAGHSDPTPPRKKLLAADGALTKQVLLGGDGSHPVTIGAGLPAK
jgi:hypothetical protein